MTTNREHVYIRIVKGREFSWVSVRNSRTGLTSSCSLTSWQAYQSSKKPRGERAEWQTVQPVSAKVVDSKAS